MPWDEFIKTSRVLQRTVVVVYKFNNNYTDADPAQNDSGTLVNFIMGTPSHRSYYSTQNEHHVRCTSTVRAVVMMRWKGGTGRTSPRRGTQRGGIEKLNKHGDGEILVLFSLRVSRLGRLGAHSAVLNLTVVSIKASDACMCSWLLLQCS